MTWLAIALGAAAGAAVGLMLLGAYGLERRQHRPTTPGDELVDWQARLRAEHAERLARLNVRPVPEPDPAPETWGYESWLD